MRKIRKMPPHRNIISHLRCTTPEKQEHCSDVSVSAIPSYFRYSPSIQFSEFMFFLKSFVQK